MTFAQPVASLIVTLQLDSSSWAYFDALRREHFPPERNFIPAHLTLFHALPGSEEGSIVEKLETVGARQLPILLTISGVRMLGRGVAFTAESAELTILRQHLANQFSSWLTPQDRQGFRPHITVQNKVGSAEARALHENLTGAFKPTEAKGEGLLLWRYLGGPWEEVASIPFTGGLPRG